MKLPTTKILPNLPGARQRGLDNVEYGNNILYNNRNKFLYQNYSEIFEILLPKICWSKKSFEILVNWYNPFENL